MRYVTWDEMGPKRRVWETIGGAIVFGTIVGLALGVSAGLYIAGGLIACVAGVIGGSQHRDLRGALLRGLAGGTMFGLGVLLGYELGGEAAPAIKLPDPHILFLLTTIIPSFPLHAGGWAIGRRVRSRVPAPAVP